MKQTLNEQVSRIKSMMGLNEDDENQYYNSAVEKMGQGIHYRDLSPKEKMSLDIAVNDKEKNNLTSWYKQNGGTFGLLETKVRVKDADAQEVYSESDLANAGKVGWLFPYIEYTEEEAPDWVARAWVSMQTETIIKDKRSDMGYYYERISVFTANLDILEVGDKNQKFVDYEYEKANLTFDDIIKRRKKEEDEANA